MSQTTPLPIILCGQTTQIGHGVIAGLEPEYEVIHFVLTPTIGSDIIPLLLQGKNPTTADGENIGSGNYARVPVAVVLGGGYGDDDISQMREACYGASKEGCKRVPWLRPDLTKPTPPLGPEYGKHMVGRVKVCLEGLPLDGVGEEGEGGVVFY